MTERGDPLTSAIAPGRIDPRGYLGRAGIPRRRREGDRSRNPVVRLVRRNRPEHGRAFGDHGRGDPRPAIPAWPRSRRDGRGVPAPFRRLASDRRDVRHRARGSPDPGRDATSRCRIRSSSRARPWPRSRSWSPTTTTGRTGSPKPCQTSTSSCSTPSCLSPGRLRWRFGARMSRTQFARGIRRPRQPGKIRAFRRAGSRVGVEDASSAIRGARTQGVRAGDDHEMGHVRGSRP